MFLTMAVLGCSNSAAPPKQSTEDWLGLLTSPDAGVRCSAVKAISCAGPEAPGVLPALLSATEDSSDDVKRFAGVAIVSFGDGARPALDAFMEAKRTKRPQGNTQGAPNPKSVPDSFPNPNPVPDSFLSCAEMLVYIDPYFAGTLLPTAILASKTEDDGYRVVAVRALGNVTVGSLENREQVKLVTDALKQARKGRHKAVADEAACWLKKIGEE